jgi:hypothetical protein
VLKHFFVLGHAHRPCDAGFARGATESLEVHLPAPVGDLKRVVVRQIACSIDGEGVLLNFPA